MDNKLLLIIVAFIFIIMGGYLIITNQPYDDVSGDDLKIPLKTQDLELFEINLPAGSNFTIKNEASGMKYYQNNGTYAANLSGIIISKGLTDSLIGDNSQNISNSSTEQIYSYKFKNETGYKFVSNQGDVDFILMGNDLNLLKEVADTIRIKDVGNL